MSKIIFNYKGQETIIPCSKTEKMSDMCLRYVSKIQIDKNKIYFIYNGNIINQELIYEEISNEEDKKRNIINVLVEEINKTVINNNIIKSKDIICPQCKEEILIKINDYKINLNGCKNGHIFKEILLKDYENTQKIDISKIICDICKIKNKGSIYNNELYKCLTCGNNLCPLCKSNHEKKHKIVLYEHRNYLCEKHKENFTRFCKTCNKNICMKCEKDHKGHDNLYLGDILPNDNVYNEINEFKKNIDKLFIDIKDIIQKFKIIMENIQLYYNLSDSFITEEEHRNYQRLKNINEFINYNNIINKDIKGIISDNNIQNKIKKLFNIYDKMNRKENNKNSKETRYIISEIGIKEKEVNNKIFEKSNYIIAEFDIKENEVNKDIEIIKTFEHCKREYKWKDEKNDYKYNNENEIREKCKIMINNKEIPFTYNYKFNKKGKFIIKYYFSNNIIRANNLFRGCESLTKIDLSNFNASNVEDMSYIFGWCKSLKNINLSNINTQNLIDMNSMFFCCKSLTYLDLSFFNTQKVTNMNSLFGFCESLQDINLSSFKLKMSLIWI